MSKILYYFIYAFGWIHAVFPLKFLYFLSDMLYFPVYYLVRYRRKMVRRNLTNAFPDKSKKEILKIEKAFYHHFCDYIFETIKMLHISDEEMKRRFVFKNIELIRECLNKKQSCLLLLGHYGNWEWVTSIMLWVENPDTVIGEIYRPLKNKAFDAFFHKLRSRFHSVGIAKNDTLREIVKIRRTGKTMLLGFISDQKPSIRNIHYWTPFLNQETAVLTGAERIAGQIGAMVTYLDVVQVKRGYYEAEIRLVADNPAETAEFEITERYIRMMETTILRNPSGWLWTHNRWKHKKEHLA